MLVGGGHAHVEVVRRLMRAPIPGIRTTLVSREVQSPYSGMLPGYLSGEWRYEQAHIDLVRLCQRASVRLVHAEVEALDLGRGYLHLARRPPLAYDGLSLNTGGTPSVLAPGARAVPVKPIGRFLPAWEELRERLRHPSDNRAPLALVGLGAGAVELALALSRALAVGDTRGSSPTIAMFGSTLLPGWPAYAHRWVRTQLTDAGIQWRDGVRVERVCGTELWLSNGERVATCGVFDVTGVGAPAWLAASGLAVDDRGFVRVAPTLQSISHANVFAAGDVAALEGQPRPKSGVYAVRAGPVLATNLRRFWRGRSLLRFRAQREALALLSNSRGETLARRGALAFSGRWLSAWKRRIDRRFVERYNGTVATSVGRARVFLSETGAQSAAPAELPAALARDLPPAMRCFGCGGKLGASALSSALAELNIGEDPRVRTGIGDDAAVLQLDDASLAITTDTLTAFTDDPYRFGRIATRHALNDLLAMGVRPDAALATVQLEDTAPELAARDLRQLLAGVQAVLTDEGAVLTGGHSLQGERLSLGLTALGRARDLPSPATRPQAGQALILTRALGSGVLLAAAMRAVLDGAELMALLDRMDRSNRPALAQLKQHGATALTDVTGFGLLGHLGPWLREHGLGVELDGDAVPVLAAARALAAVGIGSSLLPENRMILARFETKVDLVTADLLCDPQTAGGLLAAVPATHAERCLEALHAAGEPEATRIGYLTDDEERWILG